MKSLNSKSSFLAKSIARELIPCKVGEQIPTTPYLSKKFNAGYGTIEKVLDNLKAEGAIKLQSRGQMGRVLLEKDLLKIWRLADYGILVGLLPLPNAIEYEGLATGFTEALAQIGVQFSLNFKNGGKERVNSLVNGRCDFIVLSCAAAEMCVKDVDELMIIERLSNRTYYTGIYVIRNKKRSPKRENWKIGIDYTSYDHVSFSQREFPDNKHIAVHYVNIPYFIADGKIDAAIMLNKSLVPLDLAEQISIEPIGMSGWLEESSAAAIVTRRNHEPVRVLFKEMCNLNVIETVQRGVLDRKVIPNF